MFGIGVLIAFATLFVFMASICYTRIIYSNPGHPEQVGRLVGVLRLGIHYEQLFSFEPDTKLTNGGVRNLSK